MAIIAQNQAKAQPHFDTAQDIFDGACPGCGNGLYLTYRHIGGYSRPQPFVACANPAGGEAHLLIRISERLEGEWYDLLSAKYGTKPVRKEAA